MNRRPLWPRNRHGLRLLDVLALASSLQLALVALGVGTIAYLNGHRSVQLLARQLGSSIADQVDLQLDGVLEAPRLINRLNEQAIRSGQLDPENFAALERLFFEQISLFPVGYINYGNEAGDYLGVQRLDDGRLLVNEMRQRVAPNRQLVYPISAAGRQRQPLRVIEPIGTAREEPWYRETIKAGHPVWSSIYQWDDNPGVLSVSFNQPVRDPRSGRLQGVIGVDVILTQLSTFLQQLWGQRPGLVLVLERDGRLVASSRPAMVLRTSPGDPPRRTRIDGSDDPLVRRLGSLLFSRTDNGDLRLQGGWGRNREQLEFNERNRTVFVETMRWSDGQGLDWLVLVVIPQEGLQGIETQGARLALVLCILALLVAIVVTQRLNRWILRPLEQLTTTSRHLTEAVSTQDHGPLSFQPQLPPASPLEVQTLAEVLEVLVQRLNDQVEALRRSGTDLAQEVQRRSQALDLSLRSEQKAIASAQLRQSVLARLSHELRTPLTSVLGYTRLALRQELPSRVREYLDTIEGAAREMLRLTEDFLDLSRLESGRVQLETLPFDLDELVEDVIDLVSLQAQVKGLTLVVAIGETVAPCWIGDAARLRQVLVNLLVNAIKFTPGGSVRLRIEQGGSDGGGLRFEVCDSGIGMDAEQQARVFEAWSQAEPSTSRRFGGSGLGLAICRELVQLMGGELQLQSQLGQGTTLSVALPCPLGPRRDQESWRSPPAPPAGMVIELEGELDPEEVAVLQTWLRISGWPPLRTEARGTAPTLLLLVLGSDVGVGRELASRERQRLAPGGRLLALVRRLDADAYLEATTAPWDGIVERPLLLRGWNEALQRALAGSAG
ncbi:MAG: HAMP domain-containing protein [Synechococcus sp. Tobar2m-G35]|nr:HAMP domain-containing protein [Synechococcus sp. Tobar2m-G35]